MFYEVERFIVDYDGPVPCVFYHATDMYDMALLIVELSIPRSVRIIGDYIFGNGGIIIIRD